MGACRGPGSGRLGRSQLRALPLSVASLQTDSTWHNSTAERPYSPRPPSPHPSSLSSSFPLPRGSYLHSFYRLTFFSYCCTLYLIIDPHFLLYQKSRIMPVSCIHFGNKIYGNTCHWINCFSLASNCLMITHCLPGQKTVPAHCPNLLAFNCNQKLEALDCLFCLFFCFFFPLYWGLAILKWLRVGGILDL